MNEDQAVNMVKMIRALDEAEHPNRFNMERYGRQHEGCCTPCCVLGHYAARRDLQDVIRLDSQGIIRLTANTKVGFSGDPVDFDDFAILEHFGITKDQAYLLFDADGCGNAGRDIERAKYFIYGFLAGEGYAWDSYQLQLRAYEGSDHGAL